VYALTVYFWYTVKPNGATVISTNDDVRFFARENHTYINVSDIMNRFLPTVQDTMIIHRAGNVVRVLSVIRSVIRTPVRFHGPDCKTRVIRRNGTNPFDVNVENRFEIQLLRASGVKTDRVVLSLESHQFYNEHAYTFPANRERFIFVSVDIRVRGSRNAGRFITPRVSYARRRRRQRRIEILNCPCRVPETETSTTTTTTTMYYSERVRPSRVSAHVIHIIRVARRTEMHRKQKRFVRHAKITLREIIRPIV